jgi:hypothetical protein
MRDELRDNPAAGDRTDWDAAGPKPGVVSDSAGPFARLTRRRSIAGGPKLRIPVTHPLQALSRAPDAIDQVRRDDEHQGMPPAPSNAPRAHPWTTSAAAVGGGPLRTASSMIWRAMTTSLRSSSWLSERSQTRASSSVPPLRLIKMPIAWSMTALASKADCSRAISRCVCANTCAFRDKVPARSRAEDRRSH